MRKSSRNSAASNDTKHLWVNPHYEASESAIYPQRFEAVPEKRWTSSEGFTKVSKESC